MIDSFGFLSNSLKTGLKNNNNNKGGKLVQLSMRGMLKCLGLGLVPDLGCTFHIPAFVHAGHEKRGLFTQSVLSECYVQGAGWVGTQDTEAGSLRSWEPSLKVFLSCGLRVYPWD